jgi:hypothetical protein
MNSTEVDKMADNEELTALMDEVYRTALKIAKSFELGAKNEVDALEKILVSPWVSDDYKSAVRNDAKRLYNDAKEKIENLIPKCMYEKTDDPICAAAQDESRKRYELKAKRIKQLALAR